MSYHDREEILVPPAGVCFKPPTVYKGLCPECKYFDGCTHHGKVDGTSAPKAKRVKREIQVQQPGHKHEPQPEPILQPVKPAPPAIKPTAKKAPTTKPKPKGAFAAMLGKKKGRR